MARVVLLSLLILLFLEIMLGFDLSITLGLSVKNAYLYGLLIVLALRAAVEKQSLDGELVGINLLFVALLAYALLSWGITEQLNPWNLEYNKTGAFIALKTLLVDHYLFFLAFLYGTRSVDDALWVAKGLILFVAMSNVITLFDVFNVPDLGIIHERRDGRVSGPLGESNQYGAFMVLFLPSLVATAYDARRWRRIPWVVGMFASIAVLLLTTSRGALVGLLTGILGGGLYLHRYLPKLHLTKTVVHSLLATVLVLVAVGVQYGDLFYERFVGKADIENLEYASSGRTENWTTALSTQAEHPVTFLGGVGWNTYKMMFDGRASHNTFLGYLFELGIIGLALFVLLLWAIFKTAKRAVAVAPPESRRELIVFVIGFLSLMAAVTFVNLYKPWFFVWAYAGLMMRVAVEMLKHSAQPRSSPHLVPTAYI